MRRIDRIALIFLALPLFAAPILAAPEDVVPPVPMTLAEDVLQTTQPLTLRDAIVRSLESNTDLAVARLTPDIRREQILASRGIFDAIITGQANFSRRTSQTFTEPPAPAPVIPGFTPQPTPALSRTDRQTDAFASIQKFWPTGTTTSIDGSLDRIRAGDDDVEYRTGMNFNIRQSLLRGLNPKANLAGIRQAENNYQNSRYQLTSQIINTVANVETTYWNLALDYELLEVQRFSMQLAEQQLYRTRSFVEVGKMSPLEITNGQAELASRQRDYIDARNRLQIRAIDLLLLIDNDVGEDGSFIMPQPVTEPKLPTLPGDNKESIRIALSKRPDLYQAELDLENGKLQVVTTFDGLLPQLDLVGTYGLVGRGSHLDRAYDRMEDRDFDNYSVGVDFQVPLPNRRARGEYRAAKISREQLDLAIDNLRQHIRGDVIKARIDLQNDLESVGAARVAVQFEEEKLINEEEKWRNGLSTSILVFQAQRDLINARNQLLIRIASAIISETNLFVQEGSLLEMRGLSAEGGEVLK